MSDAEKTPELKETKAKPAKKDGRKTSSAENLKKARATREANAVKRMIDKVEEKKKALAAKRSARVESDEEIAEEPEQKTTKEIAREPEPEPEQFPYEEYSEEDDGDESPLEELKLVRAKPAAAPKRKAPSRARAKEPKEPRSRAPSRAEKQLMSADMIGDAIAKALAAKEIAGLQFRGKPATSKRAAKTPPTPTPSPTPPVAPKYSFIRI
jgi:hypothetical protein